MSKFIYNYEDAYSIAKEYTSSNEALENTLKYIFDQRYPCYMLCVKSHSPILYKLDSISGNPSKDKQINKTLKNRKIKSTTKTWRVMGCIIKPFKKEPTFAKEWLQFLILKPIPQFFSDWNFACIYALL